MNKVILVGRLTRDPDIYKKDENITVKFSLAVDRRFKTEGGQEADFPSVVAFGKTADFISKYFFKGMKIGLVGRIQTGSYEKDGVKHYTTDVVAEEAEFAESKKADAGEAEPPNIKEYLDVPEGIENDLPFR